ncbi:MAG: radical SAM protein [Magnetococcales bacterium]|nr:radical SAM protein [Magnetococcales bacterium]
MSDTYAIDSHKLIYHPKRVTQLLDAKGNWQKAQKIYPIYMEISPIGACNHRCNFCAVDYLEYKSNRLKENLLKQRLHEMGTLGIKAIMYAGEGEPLLHTGMNQIIEETRKAGINAALTSNFTIVPRNFIQKSLPHLSWIKISINAGTRENYAHIHQTKPEDFDKALEHMAEASHFRKKHHLNCTIGAQALLLPENATEMETLARICRDELKIDYLVIKPYSQHPFSQTRVYEEINYQPFMDLEIPLTTLSTPNFKVIFRKQTMARLNTQERYDRCHATPHLWAYIMADGTVSACSAFLGDERFEYGNIYTNTFQEIWEGEKRQKGWEFINQELDISTCRTNCRMDAVNRYLHKLQSDSIPHVNFI